MVYIKKVMKPVCRKSIFKKLLIKLMKEFTFSVNNLLKKSMGISHGWSHISDLCQHLPYDVVAPVKAVFYKQHVEKEC